MTGRIIAVYGNMVTAEAEGPVVQNSVAHCCREDGARLLAEVIRIRGRRADLQVFEETRGLQIGDRVEFQRDMLSVVLGPGLLGQIYDGLQNPLPRLAERSGFFLEPGQYLPGLPLDRPWAYAPRAEPLDVVGPGDTLGTVREGIFEHHIMVPFGLRERFEVASTAPAGEYTVEETVAVLADGDGREHPVAMQQSWPVKVPLNVSRRRLMPTSPLVTGVRMIDSIFPIVHGGTYCIPGPFGAGKTVLQQITSRHADVDIVIVAACGERAGEVVETIREFPALEDPRTGRTLMERTIIVCNTSAMPVAAREASVYTAATLGEYYRQMGLRVLLLADSTSRWAQAMREVSGRLEEIPGEEAFPAYLESRIAGFYERAGAIELRDGRVGSLTIGGTVSPAGGNFEEPVTQGTVKVVGAFHGLSTARAQARRYPAIDPLQSWSRYTGILDRTRVAAARALLRRGDDVRQMMTVVGEDGVPVADFTMALKADFFDQCYLQQDAFDAVDGATSAERQAFVFDRMMAVVELEFGFSDRDACRATMVRATDLFRNWNYVAYRSEEFERVLTEVDAFIAGYGAPAADGAPAPDGNAPDRVLTAAAVSP
jgi:V/A-type H+/Na+-transporting ATPase subunit A